MGAAAHSAKVVARYVDGRMTKGFAQNFDPTRDAFALTPHDASDAPQSRQVRVSELKALFFVKDFDGEPDYSERREFLKAAAGRRIRVRFTDGEELVGTSLTYHPSRTGFFLFPGDPFSNNEKVFVVALAVADVTGA
ncbi:MAG: hypothetical protein AB7G23_11385 [Vicinamibacterales bacterium]